MDMLPMEDLEYLIKQPNGNINIILAEMTALMKDTDYRVNGLESQGWAKRMFYTVTGKNRLTKEEIQKNHDKLNAYMSEAIAELYNQQCISYDVIMSLGRQLNEIYLDHEQLKEIMGAFVSKLNEKIDSVDGFHMLCEEIKQNVYNQYTPFVDACRVLAQLDDRTLSDQRKLDIIRRSLEERGIINQLEIGLEDFLMDILNIDVNNAGKIYLELGTIHGNKLAEIIMKLIEQYQFLPQRDNTYEEKRKILENFISYKNLDTEIILTLGEIYDDFLQSKIDIKNGEWCISSKIRVRLGLFGIMRKALDNINIDFKELNLEELGDNENEIETDDTFSFEESPGYITQDTYSMIKDTCEMFLMYHSPSKYDAHYKLKDSLGIMYEEIYLAHDDTLFKTGKNGFAITESGIYCRGLMESYTNYVSFEELSNAEEIYVKGSYVYADDEIIAYFSGSESDREDLKELFEEIAIYVRCDFM